MLAEKVLLKMFVIDPDLFKDKMCFDITEKGLEFTSTNMTTGNVWIKDFKDSDANYWGIWKNDTQFFQVLIDNLSSIIKSDFTESEIDLIHLQIEASNKYADLNFFKKMFFDPCVLNAS
jgi:hypothetical protein